MEAGRDEGLAVRGELEAGRGIGETQVLDQLDAAAVGIVFFQGFGLGFGQPLGGGLAGGDVVDLRSDGRA